MEQSRSQRIKISMNHGLVIGIILIAFAFISTLAGSGTGSLFQLIHWIIIIGAVFYSMKTWRDSYCGGFISYSQALGFGVRTMFFASVIYGFYTMVYMNWINPAAVDETLAAIEESYYLLGFNDQQIEQFMVVAQKMQTPGWQMFTTIVGTTFTGFILSLIVSFFVRKDNDPFLSAMDGIDENRDQENQ